MAPATTALMIVGPAKFDEGDTTMAEGRSVTARHAVEGVLKSEHAHVLRESVALMVREIMALEGRAACWRRAWRAGAGRRQSQRNGYRDRRWDTRVGESSRSRSFGRQLPAVVLGAAPARGAGARRGRPGRVCQRREHRQGRPSRRADGVAGDYRRTRSAACAVGWMSRVDAFRARRLEGAYPYLWLDAKVDRVREHGGVRSEGAGDRLRRP